MTFCARHSSNFLPLTRPVPLPFFTAQPPLGFAACYLGKIPSLTRVVIQCLEVPKFAWLGVQRLSGRGWTCRRWQHETLSFSLLRLSPPAAAAALDGIDGVLARRLNQQSRLGAFLDVAVDNVSRAIMWAKAVPGPLGAAVPCLEWAVFLSTHTLSEGSAVWKSADGGVFHRAPRWVSGRRFTSPAPPSFPACCCIENRDQTVAARPYRADAGCDER